MAATPGGTSFIISVDSAVNFSSGYPIIKFNHRCCTAQSFIRDVAWNPEPKMPSSRM